MGFHLMVILRSTTGPYGRPMLEVAYGEIIFTPPRLYGSKLGKSGWGVDMKSSMLDIPGSTPVWAQYIIFLFFLKILKLICIMFFFKNIYTV